MLHCHDLFQTQRPEQRQFELNFRPECRIDCQNHKNNGINGQNRCALCEIGGDIGHHVHAAMAGFYGHQTPHFGTYATEKNSPSQAISAPTAARAILEFFPRLKHTKLVRTWGGMMDECADKVPVIDTCKEVEGLAIACGFTGHGFGIGSITGLLLSELLLDVKTSTLPIDAFRYDRF